MITFIIGFLIFGAYLVKKENLNKYFLFVTIVFASLSFFVVAYPATDLYRHYTWLDFFKSNANVSQIFTSEYFADRKLWGIYLLGLSKLPSKSFLPCISVFIIYFMLFSLIKKISMDHNVKRKSVIYSFTFLMLVVSFGSMVYGIRNVLAFSILARVLYMDLIEKRQRKLCFLIYLMLTQIHMSVAVFVLLRIIAILKNKYSYLFVNTILLFWRIALLPMAIKILTLFNLPAFYSINDKIGLYMQSERFSTPTAYSKLALLIIVIVIYLVEKKKIDRLGFVEYNRFFSLVLVFVIGSFWQYDLFVRSVNLVVFLFIFYLLVFYNLTSSNASSQTAAYSMGNMNIKNYNIAYTKFLLLIMLFTVSLVVFYADYITMQKYILFTFL